MLACPHRPECPGCDLIELGYAAQLQAKEDAVRERLAGYETLADVVVGPCAGTDERTRFRRRVKWAVDGPSIGLFGPSHRVIDTPECLVAPEAALRVAEALRGRPAEDEVKLSALDLRLTGDGATVVTLVIEAPTPEGARAHAEALAAALDPRLATGVAWSHRRPGAPTTLGGAPQPIRGQATVTDRIGIVDAIYPPGAFSQVHAGQTTRLHRLLRDALAGLGPAHVVDLFAGTGSMGLALADLAAQVTLVEPFAPAAEAARRAAPTATVRACGAEEALADLPATRPLVVVADPPRTGLSARAIAGLARLRPDRLLMVSCEPATLARDLSALATWGLRTASVAPIDMMPGTSQVEAVAVLSPGEPAPPRVLGRGDRLLVLDKPPHLPTIPHPEWPSSLLERASKLLPGASAAHRLDEGTSGVVAFVAGKRPFQPALKVYLALVRGVVRRSGTIQRPIREAGRDKPAETRFRRLAVAGGHSLIQVELVTGRTHQIRRHFAALGHPVLGDERYGDPASNRFMAARHGLIRPFLHAALLELDGARFESALWPDLEAVLDSLGN